MPQEGEGVLFALLLRSRNFWRRMAQQPIPQSQGPPPPNLAPAEVVPDVVGEPKALPAPSDAEGVPTSPSGGEFYNAAGPSKVDVERAEHMKKEQEHILMSISNRIEHLKQAERKVWKEISTARKSCVSRQEAQLRQQAKMVERMHQLREKAHMEANLREICGAHRQFGQNARRAAAQGVQARKLHNGEQTRDEARKLGKILEETSHRTKELNYQKADDRRCEREQFKLERAAQKTQTERERSYANALRFNTTDEQLRELESRIQKAEQEELECLNRLKNSERVRESVVQEMQMLRLAPRPMADDITTTPSLTPRSITPGQTPRTRASMEPRRSHNNAIPGPQVAAPAVPRADAAAGVLAVGTPDGAVSGGSSRPTTPRGTPVPPSRSGTTTPRGLPASGAPRAAAALPPRNSTSSAGYAYQPRPRVVPGAVTTGSATGPSRGGPGKRPFGASPPRPRSSAAPSGRAGASSSAGPPGFQDLAEIQAQIARLQRDYDNKLRQVYRTPAVGGSAGATPEQQRPEPRPEQPRIPATNSEASTMVNSETSPGTSHTSL